MGWRLNTPSPASAGEGGDPRSGEGEGRRRTARAGDFAPSPRPSPAEAGEGAALRPALTLPPGLLAAAFLLLIFGGSVGALVAAAPGIDAAGLLDSYILRVVWVTLLQAGLTTLLSVALAVPVARALARRRFPGRGLLLRLFGAALVLPVVVAVFGVVAVHGRSGWVNALASALGFTPGDYLYGLGGILLGHLVFDLPLATRVFVQALDSVPAESWRLARQLGMGPGAVFRLIDWPQIRRVLPGVASLIFLLSFLSFAVVLALGGGPRWTTVEVAIYQALRFDFDLARAVALAMVQIALLAALGLLLGRLALRAPVEGGSTGPVERPDREGLTGRIGDASALALALLIVLPPLAAVAVGGLTAPLGRVAAMPELWGATLRSLAIALASAALSLILAIGLLTAERALLPARPRLAGLVAGLGSATLLVSPLVLATGLFLLMRPLGPLGAFAAPLTALVNAAMALPYVVRTLGPPLRQGRDRYDRLCAELGIRGLDRLRLVEWPLLRPAVGLGLAIAAALSLGDLGAMALFGTGEATTLPLLLYRLLGGYRIAEAGAVALWLLLLTFAVFTLFEKGLGHGRR